MLPAWVKRCGERCGETYNRLVAPITGVRYEPSDDGDAAMLDGLIARGLVLPPRGRPPRHA